MATDRQYRVEVDLPADAFEHAPFEADAIAQRLLALWLVDLVRERRLGYGKAAQLAGMAKAAFVQLMGRHGVSPVDYDDDELVSEIEASRGIGG